MKGRSLCFLIIFSYFLISCETNPPIIPEQNIDLGKLFVSSDVDNAKIYLDSVFTNQFTPDTIIAREGNHKISLRKEGFTFEERTVNVEKNTIKDVIILAQTKQIKKVVLLEDFANVSCDPCVVSNSIIKSLDNTYNEQLVIIKYSTNFPSPTDPFYSAAPALNNERLAYYNILFVPTIIIDGVIRPVSTDEEDIKSKINNKFNKTAVFNLIISDSLDINNYKVNVETTLLDKSVDCSNIRQFVAVIESEVSFNNPPGSNGETQFYHIMRAYDIFDISLVINETKTTVYSDFSFQIKNDWNTENISAIVFIQDVDTKEIYQAYSTEFSK